MKILQLNKHTWPHYGGIEKIVDDIAKNGPAEITIDTLCITDSNVANLPEGRFATYRAKAGTKIFGMPISRDFFRQAQKLIPQYDAILLHHPFPLGFLVYLLYGQAKPMAVWYHSDVVRQKKIAWLIKPLFVAVLKKAKVVVVSHISIANNSPLLRSYISKVIEIPFAVSTASQDASGNRESHAEKTEPKLLSVGRLVYYKGYEYLLKAMVGVPAQLTIVGMGPLHHKLSALVEELKLKNVQLVDPVSDLTRYYQNCDIFVLPSVENSEAFGIVQLEAMVVGKPVINTNLPTAVPTISVHQRTGLTVEPKNVVALHNAIMTLAENKELREKYGQEAQRVATTRYSLEIFQKNLAKLITRIS